ncbi:MAG: 2Fe-2S iron-sulfur cluster-binding protein [Sulfuriferula sp.]|nr:2Fe-2S iron-sulfur cluster-binding protein [Sulfuriferula sp.]
MTQLHFNEATYQCEAGESVLDALTRQGVAVPYSCRSGVCQSCMMQSADANVPGAAQHGLKSTLQAQNYFLACACHPVEDMTVCLADSSDKLLQATVSAIRPLNNEIMCVGLDCPSLQDYRAGQFINLYRDAGFSRSYSLASVPSDSYLRLHVRRLPDGRMSNWIHDELKIGDNLYISAPLGSCFYLPGAEEQALLLIGTGSGLAPLMGILRDALNRQHAGEIHLYHGSRDTAGLYLVEELRELAAHYSNFHYTPCVSGGTATTGCQTGRAVDIALAEHPDLTGWRVFLCGNPNMVKSARKKAYLARAAMNDIYADAFVAAVN